MKIIPFDQIDLLPDLNTAEILLPSASVQSTNRAEIELYKTAMRMAMGRFLTPAQRELLEKRYQRGMSKTEIGKSLGITPSCVCKKISAAEKILRAQVEYCAEVHKAFGSAIAKQYEWM